MPFGEKLINFIFNNKEVIELITTSSNEKLSNVEALFLLYIYTKNKVTMGEISTFFNLPQSTTLFTVNKLVDQNFINRERNEEDRRIVNVTLTDLGCKTSKELVNSSANQFSKVLNLVEKQIQYILNEDEKEVIHNLIHKIKNI